MHRTQVLLEEQQYKLLRDIARKQNKSISGVLRDIIDSYSRKTGVFSFRKIEGIAEDSEVYGRDHDKALYSAK